MKTKKQKETEMLLSIIEEHKEINKSLLEHNDRLLKENRELRNLINTLQTELVFQKYAETSKAGEPPREEKESE